MKLVSAMPALTTVQEDLDREVEKSLDPRK